MEVYILTTYDIIDGSRLMGVFATLEDALTAIVENIPYHCGSVDVSSKVVGEYGDLEATHFYACSNGKVKEEAQKRLNALKGE